MRGAIGEYQTELLKNVKDDIASLHERFKQQYSNSEVSHMFQLRDLPPISGSIIWVRQIERQLDSYMRKVEAVLGEDWALHADGEKLRIESSLFRKKLDTRHLYESWVHDVQNRKLAISGRLFMITRTRASGNLFELGVNFDSQVVALFKEVRNLSWLNFQVPHSITTTSKEVKRVYPYAVSLIESARSYVQTAQTIAGMSDVAPLLNGYEKEVQTFIARGLPLRWESFVHSYELHVKQSGAKEGLVPGLGESRHLQYVRDLAVSIAALQAKTSTLTSINDKIQAAVTNLKTCPFESTALRSTMDSIQNAVDKLNLEEFANLGSWVERLNTRIEQVLQERLAVALGSWAASFNVSRLEDDQQVEGSSSTSVNVTERVLVFPSFRMN